MKKQADSPVVIRAIPDEKLVLQKRFATRYAANHRFRAA